MFFQPLMELGRMVKVCQRMVCLAKADAVVQVVPGNPDCPIYQVMRFQVVVRFGRVAHSAGVMIPLPDKGRP